MAKKNIEPIHETVINTKFGNLLFIETRDSDNNTNKEVLVYTLDKRYLTFLKAYWWDLDGINAELAKEHTIEIIVSKLENNPKASDKLEQTRAAVRRIDKDGKLEDSLDILIDRAKRLE